MRDLFVNGCSYATGWHNGKAVNEKDLPTLTSKDEFTDTLSWVQHFANLNNVENCWNHSIVAKPIEMTYTDTVGFCEQYKQKYKNYNNLFAIIELTDPGYRQFDPVTLKGMSGNELETFDKDYSIVPIVFRTEESLITKQVTPWRSVFVKMKKNTDYLAEDQFAEQIDASEILEGELARHKTEKDFAHHTKKDNTLTHLELSREVIDNLSNYLLTENIAHVIYWVGGRQDKFKKIMDKYFKAYMKNNRMIPLNTYTGIDYSLKHSIKPKGVHPDQAGHIATAKFLNNYVKLHNLTKKPQLDYIESSM